MTHLGILGAGQLGAYLARAAHDLGVETTVLAQNADETAVAVADHVVYGEFNVNTALQHLIRECDVVTFEKEDIPVPVLEHLAAAEQAATIKVAPNVNTMLLLQNKAKQKHWLVEHGFPTAHFIVPEPRQTVREIQQQLGSVFVLKTQRGGYDGLGVKVVRSVADADAFRNLATIAETFVEHKRELAVLVARNANGDTVAYPSVEMFFNDKGNVLRHVVCPADVEDSVNSAAIKLATDAVAALATVGVFAVELFLQGQQLLINEISPRVHNTGHLTIESQPTSQFEQHIRVVCGMPLGAVSAQNAGAMINLLCEPKLESACRQNSGIFTPAKHTHVHWYNKKSFRPMRKMGHITVTGTSGSESLHAAERYLQSLTA